MIRNVLIEEKEEDKETTNKSKIRIKLFLC